MFTYDIFGSERIVARDIHLPNARQSDDFLGGHWNLRYLCLPVGPGLREDDIWVSLKDNVQITPPKGPAEVVLQAGADPGGGRWGRPPPCR